MDIFQAVQENNIGFVQEYINKGEDVNAQGINKNTPLHYAALNGNLEIIELFINKKANINAQNGNGNTPLHIAALHCPPENKLAIMNLFINPETNINLKNDEGQTPKSILEDRGYRIDEKLKQIFKVEKPSKRRGILSFFSPKKRKEEKAGHPTNPAFNETRGNKTNGARNSDNWSAVGNLDAMKNGGLNDKAYDVENRDKKLFPIGDDNGNEISNPEVGDDRRPSISSNDAKVYDDHLDGLIQDKLNARDKNIQDKQNTRDRSNSDNWSAVNVEPAPGTQTMNMFLARGGKEYLKKYNNLPDSKKQQMWDLARQAELLTEAIEPQGAIKNYFKKMHEILNGSSQTQTQRELSPEAMQGLTTTQQAAGRERANLNTHETTQRRRSLTPSQNQRSRRPSR